MFTQQCGVFQPFLFLDAGNLKIAKEIFTTGSNSANLYGGGVGLNWQNEQGWSITSSLAMPIGELPSLLSGRDSFRTWLKIQRNFN